MKRFREKRAEDTKPMLLKLGVALSVPIAGYLVSDLRFQASTDSAAGDDHTQGTDHKSGAASRAIDGGRGLKNELHVLQNEEALASVMRGTSATPTDTEAGTKVVEESSDKIMGNVEALLSLIRIVQERCSVSPLWSTAGGVNSTHVEGVLPLLEESETDQYGLQRQENTTDLVRSPNTVISGNEGDTAVLVRSPSTVISGNEDDTAVLVRSPSTEISGNEDDLFLTQVISQPSVQDLDVCSDAAINLPNSESSEIEESLLLPEVNRPPSAQEPEIVKSVDTITTKSQSKDAEKEREIALLGSLVNALLERESKAEIQMLEYWGMKEQETAVRELKGRLEMSSMEAKILGLKIESLQEDNQRLKLEASKSFGTMQELDSERAKVQNLKKRLKSIRVRTREKLASLEQRINMLQEQEQKRREDYSVAQSKLKRLQELEEEAAELKRHNFDMERENLDLAHKLEHAQASISSIPQGPQAEVMEEVGQLKEANGKLEKEMEQLQADRFADVEELVYLRWLNACLRYETKNHTPPPGKTAARDLSSRLSPESEEKAKQLILDYANERAVHESNLKFLQDPDSQYSYYASLQGVSDEYDDALLDIPCMNKDAGSRKQPKFLGKLKKLVTRKSSRAPSSSCASNHSTCSMDDVPGRYSSDSISSCFSDPQADVTGAWNTQSSCRSPLGATNLRQEEDGRVARCRSDLGASVNLRRMGNGDDGEKVRLSKFAQVLESTRARASPEHIRVAYFNES